MPSETLVVNRAVIFKLIGYPWASSRKRPNGPMEFSEAAAKHGAVVMYITAVKMKGFAVNKA